MNALTFETGTDGDEKRRRSGGKRLCSAVQTESYHMAVMILFCTALVRSHSTRKNSRVDFYASSTMSIFNMHGTQYHVLMP